MVSQLQVSIADLLLISDLDDVSINKGLLDDVYLPVLNLITIQNLSQVSKKSRNQQALHTVTVLDIRVHRIPGNAQVLDHILLERLIAVFIPSDQDHHLRSFYDKFSHDLFDAIQGQFLGRLVDSCLEADRFHRLFDCFDGEGPVSFGVDDFLGDDRGDFLEDVVEHDFSLFIGYLELSFV